MKVSLKEIVIPVMRSNGFKGSFPHFRRLSNERVDLITFQFDKWGGGFVIEISRCPAAGFETAWGKHIPPNKVTAHDLHPNQRIRLQPHNGSGTDSWFRFQDGNFRKVAKSALPFIEKTETWWNAD